MKALRCSSPSVNRKPAFLALPGSDKTRRLAVRQTVHGRLVHPRGVRSQTASTEPQDRHEGRGAVAETKALLTLLWRHPFSDLLK